MKTFLSAIVTGVLLLVPSIAQSQTIPSTVAAGPHGYDWEVGWTFSCTNHMGATSLGGPSTQTERVSRANSGAILFHTTGPNYDAYAYNVYVPAKKMWTSPIMVGDGSYGSETTTQSGRKMIWTGTWVDTNGNTTQIRDTEVYSATSFTDLGESRLNGTWKPQYNITCTKI
jgi:hypothetical protein